jgi:alkylated DNA nucleotide flippase Atl1
MTPAKAKPAARSKRRTARQKLEAVHASHGKVFPVPPEMRRMMGPDAATMVVARPTDVDDAMRAVPKGKLLTMTQLRSILARDAGADAACALTTGIFVRLAAEAAEEDRAAGRSRFTPWWRTIKDGGRLNDKFPGGVKAQAARLLAEGHVIERGRGASSLRVKGFESRLIRGVP